MKKQVFTLLTGLALSAAWANAQVPKVTGTVVLQEDGLPVVGASILVKGTSIGAITDIDGKFVLNGVPDSAKTIIISFVGTETQELPIQSVLNVVLKSDIEVLDEVMVVAYGTAKKSSFTGAASSVDAKKILKDAPVTSFEQALQGATTGLTVNTNSGQPGAGLSIRIRGTGSMNASNEPLYVIDGVPVVSGDIAVSGVRGDSKSFNVMASINPSDIEHITVLKDAAAASLYGSRAANGVILITTKKGKEGKTQVNFKANWGFSDWAVKNREHVTGEQQHELTYEAFFNEGVLYKKMTEGEAKNYAEMNANKFAPLRDHYSDWETALFKKNAFNQNYEFSAQGGNEYTNMFASLNYKKEDGMVNHTGMEGFTGRVNVTHKSKDGKTQMGANISFSKQKSEVVPEGGAYANPYFVINNYATPNVPIYNEDGSYYEGFPISALNLPNPLKDQGLDKNTSEVLRSSNSLWAMYRFFDGLTIKQTLSYDFIDNQSTTYWPMDSNNGEVHKGLMIKLPYQRHNIYSSTILNFNKTFAKKHSLDVLVGWDVDDRREQYVQAVGSNYPHNKLPELENSSKPMTVSSSYKEDHLLSLLSRVNYDYADKYYFSANYRRDGSSRLGINNRWGDFWSVSAAWRLTSEEFMKKLAFINDMKVRMSYGVNGTLPSSYYAHLGLFGYGFNYQDQPGSAPTTIPNPNLGWEKNHNLNAGLDLRLFNRLNIAVDYYYRKTTDLLQDVPVSGTTGFSTTLRNVGAMVNQGVEIDLNIDVLRDTPLKWSTGLVLSHNTNKVTKLYGGKDIIGGSSILREGESYYSWWSREWAGVDPQTGEEQWVLNTENEDGTLNRELTKDPNKAQRVIIGKPDPTLTGGWRNNISWKGLDLSALFSFSLGGHVLDNPALSFTDNDGAVAYQVIGVQQLDRWQKPGDVTKVPRRINNYQWAKYGSSRHMQSSNHLRLKMITLSYNLPSKWSHAAGMSHVRFFTSGNNLLTWAAYKNIDPEQPVDGFAGLSLPNLKSVTFGVEVGF